jgi:hypothetical protein
MNPFRESDEVLKLSEKFYNKFYSDNNPRKLILGINPGRFGAGATGIPFTDTKRLAAICKIETAGMRTHEPSSVFIYDMIDRFGGPEKFYSGFYINSVCPLGFISKNKKGTWINYNYYDDESLFKCVKPFILSSLRHHVSLGIDTGICYVLGKMNAKYLQRINEEEKFFESFIVLDHPRFIEQYRSATRDNYIAGYIEKLRALK